MIANFFFNDNTWVVFWSTFSRTSGARYQEMLKAPNEILCSLQFIVFSFSCGWWEKKDCGANAWGGSRRKYKPTKVYCMEIDVQKFCGNFDIMIKDHENHDGMM